jgi:hypothetical protein
MAPPGQAAGRALNNRSRCCIRPAAPATRELRPFLRLHAPPLPSTPTPRTPTTEKCVPNAPNCGKVGTPCCVSDGGSTTNSYCMGPTGASPGFFCTKGPVPMCSVCPPDWRTKLNNKSFEYWSCKSN